MEHAEQTLAQVLPHRALTADEVREMLPATFDALGFLHRQPSGSLSGRWMIFLAALVPWLIGLGIAAALMLGLFLISDMFA